jgi:pimeloyl-ACP methyl ester carboxylesterase
MRLLLALAALLSAALALPPLWYALFPPAALELPPAGRRVEVSPGLGVNAIEAGAGPAVVLVHGHPGNAYEWQPCMAELLALLAALDLREVTLVGSSYGGATSITAAKRDPSRLARLVLVGSVGPGIESTRPKLPEPVLEFVAGPVLSWIESVPPVAARVRAAFMAAAFAPDAPPDWFMALTAANFARPLTLSAFRSEGRDLGGRADLDPAPIRLPILILQGDADRLVPPVVAENLKRRAPHAELRQVPRAGHAIPITHTALLADAIAELAAPPAP